MKIIEIPAFAGMTQNGNVRFPPIADVSGWWNPPAMVSQPPARLLLTLVFGGGLLLASAAVFLSASLGDPIGPVVRQSLTFKVGVGLLAWHILAWASRWLMVGRLDEARLTMTPSLVWGGFRVALLIAAMTIIVCGLAAFILGLEVKTAFVTALVLVCLVTVFTGFIGGAYFNSLLIIKWLNQRLSR